MWSSIALGCIIVALAVIAYLLPTGPLVRWSSLTPIAYALVIFADAATAIILLSTWRHASRGRSTLILAISFAAAALFTLQAVLTLPLLPLEPPFLASSAQTGIWLYVFWHVSAAAGALAYIVIRRTSDQVEATRRFVTVSASVAGALVAIPSFVAFAFGSRLPPLVEHASFSTLMTAGVGPVVVGALALATWFAFRIASPRPIDRALAISSLALTAELTLLIAGSHRYSISYYAGRGLVMFAAIFVLASAMRTLIAARVRLHAAEDTIVKLAGEASQRAGRIRALWEITSDKSRPQGEAFQTILQAATSAIRPGKNMFGCLSHLEDDDVVMDAISWNASEHTREHFVDTVFPGATFKLHETMASRLLTESGTRAWNDLTDLHGGCMLWEELGWKNLIGTRVEIGRRTYFLIFASAESLSEEPLTADDCAYIDVVASFFATRFSEDLHFERLQFQIEHDALTGLHSRAQFRRAIRAECAAGGEFTIAFVNIDEFRHVNERHGHMLGDEVLVEVAVALGSVNPLDLVARMNGDEFGVLVRRKTPLPTTEVLDAYAAQFRTPFQTGDRDGTRLLKLSASIGAARFPRDGTSAEELMRRADVALSVAKGGGGSRTAVFDASMEHILETSHVRLVELADAIGDDQLALVYQPTFDLVTRAVTGAEALVRWDHPERGRLAPAEFLPFAERNGLMTSLTRWVFRRLTRDFTSGIQLPPGFRVYFNIAAQTLDDFGFIAELNETLRAFPDLAGHLGVELTETAAMQNIEGSMHTINLLRKWGISVAIDDFGTGFSSLSYLKQFTVDVVKIDRSFVSGLPADERDGAITDMLLRITDRFGFATLAEGIETKEQADWLTAHGCRSGQGYLMARPDSFEVLCGHLNQQQLAPSGSQSQRSGGIR